MLVSVKNQARLRRARRARMKIRELGVHRLSVHRTPRHMYAQVFSPDGSQVLASASTLEPKVCSGQTGNMEAAAAIGKTIAKRAQKAGVEKIAFDRGGLKYHGRVKALAEAVRAGGLQF